MLRAILFCLALLLAPPVLAQDGGGSALPAFRGMDMEHLLLGHWRGPDRVSGYHLADRNGRPVPCPLHAESVCEPLNNCCGLKCNARAEGESRDDAPWRAEVHIRRDCASPWVKKDSGSTMFPTGWSPQQLRKRVRAAYESGRQVGDNPDKWCGCWQDLELQGYQTDGRIDTAWPVIGGGACGCPR